MTKVQKAISYIGVGEIIVLSSFASSITTYMNVQMAFLSSLFVILGSSYAYRNMVVKKVESNSFEDKRDLFDEIEDPHELYEKVNDEVEEGVLDHDKEINNAPVEDLDLKAIVKDERAKIKIFNKESVKQGVRGSASFFRLVPYAILVLGFISLQNNGLLDISVYLPSLLLGIVVGSVSAKELF